MSKSDDICAAMSAAGFNLCAEYIDVARAAGSAQKATQDILNADFRKKNICDASFPDDINSSDGVLSGPIVAQVSSVCNIGQPSHAQHENSIPCTLLIKVTDGHTKATALCINPIAQLTTNTPPGTKIKIHGGTKYSNGKILLCPSTCTWLGGTVQALIDTWKANRYALNMRKSITSVSNTGNTPPKFDFHLSGSHRPPLQVAPKAQPQPSNRSPGSSAIKKDKRSSCNKIGAFDGPSVTKLGAPSRKADNLAGTKAATSTQRATYRDRRTSDTQMTDGNSLPNNSAVSTGGNPKPTTSLHSPEPPAQRRKPKPIKPNSESEVVKLARRGRLERGSESPLVLADKTAGIGFASRASEPVAAQISSDTTDPRNIYSKRKPSDARTTSQDSRSGSALVVHRTTSVTLSPLYDITESNTSEICDYGTDIEAQPPATIITSNQAWPELPQPKPVAASDPTTSRWGSHSIRSQGAPVSRKRTDSSDGEGNNLLDFVKSSVNTKSQKKRYAVTTKDSLKSNEPVNEPWACSACTFVNHPDLSSCEICDQCK